MFTVCRFNKSRLFFSKIPANMLSPIFFRSGLRCGSDRDPYGRRRAGPMRDREGESGACAIAVEFVCWG